MAPPPDGQTAADALRHVSQNHLASAIGWIVGTLAGIVISLLGYIGIRESRKVNALFEWKDGVVDPALKEIPQVYVTKHDLEVYVHQPNARDHERIMVELGDQRVMLEELLRRG